MTPPAPRPESALLINGWRILLAPEFAARYAALLAEATRLKAMLPAEAFRQHPAVKLGASVRRLITEIVPADPNAPAFQLTGALAKFRRAKGHGLPPRYRLFWTFSNEARVIIFLYLNDESTLRKEGARSDPYERFKRLIERGAIGASFEQNFAAWQQVTGEEHGEASTPAPAQTSTGARRQRRRRDD